MSILRNAFYRFKLRIQRPKLYLENKRQPRVTYAQLKEDLVIGLLIGKVNTFIDIGAYDGIEFSNTFLFALKGASGLSFEPIKDNFLKLKWLYIFNPRLICIHEGVSDKEQVIKIRRNGPVSSIDETADQRLRELVKFDANAAVEVVRARPLDYWLGIYPKFRETDLISIDVEGHELAALKGINLGKFKAKCFIVETHHSDLWASRDYPEINGILESASYKAVLKNKFNTFWLRNDLVAGRLIEKIVTDFSGYTKLI